MTSFERRNVKGGCEIRTAPSGKPMIAGYAAVFNSWSQNLGGFVEQIDTRAFDKTLKEADVRALVNHDSNWLLGRSSNGTLRISADSRGLEYEIDVNEKDPDGQRALAKVERGDFDGSSFGFRAIDDAWNTKTAPRERTLKEVALRDLGPVTYPAYLETTTHAAGAMRTLAGALGVEVRDVEAAFELGNLDTIGQNVAEERERIVLPEERAAGDVAWGPEDGFQDLCNDVSAALNDGDECWRWCCFDAATSLDKVLVTDWEENVTYVVPIEIGSDQEPIISDPSVWVPVEQGWLSVEADDTDYMFARTIGPLLTETRAGKTLSAASKGTINEAIGQLQRLISDAEGDGADAASTDAPDEEPDDPNRALTALEVEERLVALRARRYPPSLAA